MRRIQVLGAGCPRCDKLRQTAETVVAQLGIDATVEQIADVDAILRFDVLLTPALVIDGEVKLVGRTASAEEIRRMLL